MSGTGLEEKGLALFLFYLEAEGRELGDVLVGLEDDRVKESPITAETTFGTEPRCDLCWEGRQTDSELLRLFGDGIRLFSFFACFVGVFAVTYTTTSAMSISWGEAEG